jgi:hypothetical protein
VNEYKTDTNRNNYDKDTDSVPFPIVFKSEVIPDVVSAITGDIAVGGDGYLNLVIKNIGSLDGVKATVKIIRNANSPVVPVDSDVFIGDFPAGSTTSCKYKTKVAKAGQNMSYPVDVVVVYQNMEGDYIISPKETVGVKVGKKVDFVILSPAVEMNPGSQKKILVEYKNIGDSTIKSVQARISATNPFSSSSSIVDLGDMAPGQTAVASYQLSVTGNALHKEYGLNSELRYRYARNTTYNSDPLTVQVNVRPAPVNLSMIIGVLIVAALVFAAVLYRRKMC